MALATVRAKRTDRQTDSSEYYFPLCHGPGGDEKNAKSRHVGGYHSDLHCVQKKNTQSRFLLYLRGKCLDLYKCFRVCLQGIKYSKNVKIKYSLLPMT